jgi:hypothetical protein
VKTPGVPKKLCWILSAVLAVTACRNKALTDAEIAGVYVLVSVDGKRVPASVSHHGTDLEVRSGTFTLSGDGACSAETVFVPPSGREVTRVVSAVYTRDGSRLDMKWKGAGRTAGTIEDGTFTMNNEGMVFVYKK